MCGIIGYCGPKPAASILVEGLKRLEYRGYDSAGIAVGDERGISVFKREGKLFRLRERLPEELGGGWGIGHTRWATHGEVSDLNAHPHTDGTGKIAVVHNGIIENFTSLKEKLEEEGYVFRTETDSEVIAHLVASLYDGDLETSLRQTVRLLKGTYGILVMHADEPDVLVGARNGSPLVLGIGNDEMFLASDATALVAHTKQVV
ncbi:MAG: glutamine--fructose-6-phosphate transaminase (isomerizing), partial [Spirochaetota bacterium]